MYPSYKERLDPGGELEQDAKALAELAMHPLIKHLGLSEEFIEKIKAFPERYNEATELEPIAMLLGPYGWCVYSRVNVKVYREAARLVHSNSIAEAEKLLTEFWNTDNRLQIPELRVRQLYMTQEPMRLDLAKARHDILVLAYHLHHEGKYSASIPLVFAQMDGICCDITRKPAKKYFGVKFFQQKNKDFLNDDNTLAGHPLGLSALNRMFCESISETTENGKLNRHGIMHGRTLGYGTKENSTKILVALEAFLMWCFHRLRNEESMLIHRMNQPPVRE